MELWLEHDPGLPGVSGVPGAAEAVARSWAGLTGGRSRCRMRDAMHQLEQVIDPPRPPAGELRMAREEDRELLVAWEVEFVREAGVIAQAGAEADRTITRRLAGRLPVPVAGRPPREHGRDLSRSRRHRPHRAGVHAARAAREGIRERRRGGGLSPRARGRSKPVHAVHRCHQPDPQQDLSRRSGFAVSQTGSSSTSSPVRFRQQHPRIRPRVASPHRGAGQPRRIAARGERGGGAHVGAPEGLVEGLGGPVLLQDPEVEPLREDRSSSSAAVSPISRLPTPWRWVWRATCRFSSRAPHSGSAPRTVWANPTRRSGERAMSVNLSSSSLASRSVQKATRSSTTSPSRKVSE